MPNSEATVSLNPYLQTKVLAIGCGPFLVSLVSALFESGWFSFHILITESVPTNRQRLKELVDHARLTEPKAKMEEIVQDPLEKTGWQWAIQSFHSILYVSQENNIEELRHLNKACREEQKLLLPALCIQQAGFVGPLVRPYTEDCWESAWRRIHQTVFGGGSNGSSAFSSTAGAMLANVIVLEWLKAVTGGSEASAKQDFFLLDLKTLEGDWHSFEPHPLVPRLTSALESAAYVNEFDILAESYTDEEPYEWFTYFSSLTSSQAGIFHIWEEGDLLQLPLAQCRVQASDPLSEGPAQLLPVVIGSGLTHAEARREAGLAGIEAYVSRMSALLIPTPSIPSIHQNVQEYKGVLQSYVGIGAGKTIAEGIYRGLQMCLNDVLAKSPTNRKPFIDLVLLDTVEDHHCKYYLQAMMRLQGAPTIGLGLELYGFPVLWINMNGHWYGCVGLNTTLALRNLLQQALMLSTTKQLQLPQQSYEVDSVNLYTKDPIRLVIPSISERNSSEVLPAALQVLKNNNLRLDVFDMACEPFLKEGPIGVWAVQLKEEDSR